VLWSLAVIFAQPLSKVAPEFVLFFGDGDAVCNFRSGYFVVVFVGCLLWFGGAVVVLPGAVRSQPICSFCSVGLCFLCSPACSCFGFIYFRIVTVLFSCMFCFACL
jgi:hypothetical protein